MATKISAAQEAANVASLIAAVVELQTVVNKLIADFKGHDHGTTYNPFNTKINTVANSITFGTYAHTLTQLVAPGLLFGDSGFGN